jgi:hypothetical protein
MFGSGYDSVSSPDFDVDTSLTMKMDWRECQQLLRSYYLRMIPHHPASMITDKQAGLGYSGDRVLLIQGISGAFGVVWVFLFM